jgi:Predicted ATPase
MYLYYRSIRSDRPTCIFNAKAGTRRWDAAQVSLDIPLSFYPLPSSSNDKFRCLLNFELHLDAINLFLGSNASGKSTVFEVLQKIQAFVSGDSKVKGIFKPADCTRWPTLQIQRFELEILGNGGCYTYQLGIDQKTKQSLLL